MIRSFLKFLISRSLDDGATPPNWLQAAAQRDADVGKFSQEASQLDALLRSSAAAHRQAMAKQPAAPPLTLPPERQSQPTPRRSNHAMKVFVGLATAAAVLIAVSPALFRPQTPAVHAGDFSEQLAVVPGEVLRVLTQATESSQQRLPQLSPLANLSLPELPGLENLAMTVESPVRREFDAWQASWQKLKSQFPGNAQGETQEL